MSFEEYVERNLPRVRMEIVEKLARHLSDCLCEFDEEFTSLELILAAELCSTFHTINSLVHKLKEKGGVAS